MTTPIFARKSADNTVNVLDGAFEADSKFALRVQDAQVKDLLIALAVQGEQLGKVYEYAFTWTAGKLTSIVRTHGGNSETLVLTYHSTGELAGISPWI